MSHFMISVAKEGVSSLSSPLRKRLLSGRRGREGHVPLGQRGRAGRGPSVGGAQLQLAVPATQLFHLLKAS